MIKFTAITAKTMPVIANPRHIQSFKSIFDCRRFLSAILTESLIKSNSIFELVKLMFMNI